MWAQTQTVPGRRLRLQIPVSPRPAELDSANRSPASTAAAPTYRPYLCADDEPTRSPCNHLLIPEAALLPSSWNTVHRDAEQPVWPPPRKESLMNTGPTPWVCYSAYPPIQAL